MWIEQVKVVGWKRGHIDYRTCYDNFPTIQEPQQASSTHTHVCICSWINLMYMYMNIHVNVHVHIMWVQQKPSFEWSDTFSVGKLTIALYTCTCTCTYTILCMNKHYRSLISTLRRSLAQYDHCTIQRGLMARYYLFQALVSTMWMLKRREVHVSHNCTSYFFPCSHWVTIISTASTCTFSVLFLSKLCVY